MTTLPLDDLDLENDSLDTLLVGKERSPGKVTLSGHDRAQKWDVKDGDGQSGATTTYKGDKVTEFTASFYLVRDPVLGLDEVLDWETRFLLVLKATFQGKTASAVDIYHPDLAANDIKSVSVSSISGAVHDGKGGRTITVKFIEFRPPKPKTSTPAGSKSKVGAGAPDPNEDVKKQIDDLLNTAKNP